MNATKNSFKKIFPKEIFSISLVAIALTKTVKAWVPEFPEREDTIGNKAAKATIF